MARLLIPAVLRIACLLTVLSGWEKASSEVTPRLLAAGPVAPDTNKTGSVGEGVGPSSKSEMALIPAGKFVMGTKDEVDSTPHPVAVSSFYMDKYLVTQEQYQRAMGENP